MDFLTACCFCWQHEVMPALVKISTVYVPCVWWLMTSEGMKVLLHALPVTTMSVNLQCIWRVMTGGENDSTSPCSKWFKLLRSVFQLLWTFITCQVCTLSANYTPSTNVCSRGRWKKWWVKTEQLVWKRVIIGDEGEWKNWMGYIWVVL